MLLEFDSVSLQYTDHGQTPGQISGGVTPEMMSKVMSHKEIKSNKEIKPNETSNSIDKIIIGDNIRFAYLIKETSYHHHVVVVKVTPEYIHGCTINDPPFDHLDSDQISPDNMRFSKRQIYNLKHIDKNDESSDLIPKERLKELIEKEGDSEVGAGCPNKPERTQGNKSMKLNSANKNLKDSLDNLIYELKGNILAQEQRRHSDWYDDPLNSQVLHKSILIICQCISALWDTNEHNS